MLIGASACSRQQQYQEGTHTEHLSFGVRPKPARELAIKLADLLRLINDR